MDTPTFLQLRQVAPWIGLFIVVSTITYGLDLFAAALPPTASAASPAINADTADDRLLHDEVLELGSSRPCEGSAGNVLCLEWRPSRKVVGKKLNEAPDTSGEGRYAQPITTRP